MDCFYQNPDELYDGYEKQCCGGSVVSSAMTCCGDAVSGVSYIANSSLTCCGDQYVPADRAVCCMSSTGRYKVHGLYFHIGNEG